MILWSFTAIVFWKWSKPRYAIQKLKSCICQHFSMKSHARIGCGWTKMENMTSILVGNSHGGNGFGTKELSVQCTVAAIKGV